MPLHLIDFYNFKPPADLLVDREEGHAIRLNAAKTSLVSRCSPAQPAQMDTAESAVLVEGHLQIMYMCCTAAGAQAAVVCFERGLPHLQQAWQVWRRFPCWQAASSKWDANAAFDCSRWP